MECAAFEFLDFELETSTFARSLKMQYFLKTKTKLSWTNLKLCLWLQQQNVCRVVLDMIWQQDQIILILFVWAVFSAFSISSFTIVKAAYVQDLSVDVSNLINFLDRYQRRLFWSLFSPPPFLWPWKIVIVSVLQSIELKPRKLIFLNGQDLHQKIYSTPNTNFS